MARRVAGLVAAAWGGLLLAVAGVATPAAFALLPRADAGRVAARLLAQEAWLSLALAALLGLLLWRAAAGRWMLGLVAATVLLTGLGWFGVQALLPAARAGRGAFDFAQLHAFSTACFGLKALLVLWLAWRASGGFSPAPASSGSPAGPWRA
jgi:hypothetical protein